MGDFLKVVLLFFYSLQIFKNPPPKIYFLLLLEREGGVGRGEERERERERERETSVRERNIHWLSPVCTRSGDQTCNLLVCGMRC